MSFPSPTPGKLSVFPKLIGLILHFVAGANFVSPYTYATLPAAAAAAAAAGLPTASPTVSATSAFSGLSPYTAAAAAAAATLQEARLQ